MDDRPLLSAFLRRFKRNLVDTIVAARIVHSATERFRENTQVRVRAAARTPHAPRSSTSGRRSTRARTSSVGRLATLMGTCTPPAALTLPSLRSSHRTVDILATPMSGEAACCVLERWEVRGVFPRMSADELASVPLTLQTFEQSVILLRLVHASLRLLPAWTLCAPLAARTPLTPRAGSAA